MDREPDATVRPVRPLSTLQFVEKDLFFARDDARTTVADFYEHGPRPDAGPNLNRRIVAGVANNVFDQVQDNLLDQQRIERNLRNVLRKVQHDLATLELSVEAAQSGGYDLLELLRILRDRGASCFEAGEVQKPADEPAEPTGFASHHEREGSLIAWRDPFLAKGGACPDERSERRPQIVGQGAENDASLAFNLGQTPRAKSLPAQSLGDYPCHGGSDEHGRERQRVSHVRDRKASHGRYEEKVENEAASDHGRDGGSDAEPRGHDQNPQRKDQEEGGCVKK